LTLADVGQVRFDFPEKTSFSRLDSIDAVNIDLYKASTANIVSVAQTAKEELQAIQQLPQLEGRLSVKIFRDQSDDILKSLNDLKNAGIYGGVLAMGVLFLFLMKFRSTIIISIAIPVSIVFTFAFMYLLRVFAGSDISLNVVSLMGLMVAIGMLVDSSVVVLENIFRHKQDKGLGAREAAISGSREVGLAVLASTATTIVVFVSFIFAPSTQMGRFTRDFGYRRGSHCRLDCGPHLDSHAVESSIYRQGEAETKGAGVDDRDLRSSYGLAAALALCDSHRAGNAGLRFLRAAHFN
jgi:HAE1 family hydrophobic/amphiphilic exporter-1